jgi:hypothetical protein
MRFKFGRPYLSEKALHLKNMSACKTGMVELSYEIKKE